MCLESQLLEEVCATLCLLLARHILLVNVSLVEHLLEALLDIDLSLRLHQIGFVNCFLQINIYSITSREHMAHIDVLDKGLHCLGSLFHLLLAHGLGDFSGRASQASHQAVCESLVGIAIVKSLDDNALLTGVTPCK
jgi:hypothetical protein